MKTINIDATDANADWPKRRRDSELALHAELTKQYTARRVADYHDRLAALAGEAKQRPGSKLWFRNQAEGLLVPGVYAPWEWGADENIRRILLPHRRETERAGSMTIKIILRGNKKSRANPPAFLLPCARPHRRFSDFSEPDCRGGVFVRPAGRNRGPVDGFGKKHGRLRSGAGQQKSRGISPAFFITA